MPALNSKQLSFRTDSEKIEALDEVAEALDRDRSYVLNQAVDAYLEVYRWQTGHIRKAVAAADAGGPFIAHEDMKSWMESLGTPKAQLPPRATIRKPKRQAGKRRAR
ncbi:MAG: CopG family ribbon-helix-helix protein [Hyphomicrobium sp.]